MKHRRPVLVATAIVATLALTSCGGSGNEDTKAAPSNTATTAPKAKPAEDDAAAKEKAFEDAKAELDKAIQDADGAMGKTLGVQPGTYEVTEDSPDYEDPLKALDDEYLAPGTYTTKGPADGSMGCYWERMKDASGDASSTLANDMTSGSAIVRLAEGDFFKTSGCKPWVKQTS
ncbi:hypothetical protein [Streptomyces atratus]|uniref:hypothetical protein n=1 Tax=Streptomyces atratus TaxID=1893 RepID=UPI00364CC669